MSWKLPTLQKSHAAFLKATERLIDEVNEEAGKLAVAKARSDHQYTDRSGNLSSSNRYRLTRRKSGRLLRISNTAPYAAAIDKGAKPHVIRARGNGYLRFRTSSGWVRTRQVSHPGNKPYRFLRNATGEAFNLLGARFERKARALMRRRF